jgi:hypothetical protein
LVHQSAMLLEGETVDGWPPIIAASPGFHPPIVSPSSLIMFREPWGPFLEVFTCDRSASRPGVRTRSAPDTCLLLSP